MGSTIVSRPGKVKRCKVKGPAFLPAPNHIDYTLPAVGHLGAVSCAATFALATVLSLATVITALAAALSLAIVLAFTTMLGR